MLYGPSGDIITLNTDRVLLQYVYYTVSMYINKIDYKFIHMT